MVHRGHIHRWGGSQAKAERVNLGRLASVMVKWPMGTQPRTAAWSLLGLVIIPAALAAWPRDTVLAKPLLRLEIIAAWNPESTSSSPDVMTFVAMPPQPTRPATVIRSTST